MFGSKPAAIALSQSKFITEIQSLKAYKDWVGWTKKTAAAQGFALAIFEEHARTRNPVDGFYSTGSGVNRGLPLPPDSTILFKSDADRKSLWTRVELLLDNDLKLIKERQTFLTNLAAEAGKGRLRTRLNAHVVQEATYYNPSPATAKWSDMSVRDKAKAWPDHSTKVKKWLIYEKNESARKSKREPDKDGLWDNAIDHNVKPTGWPLGHDTTKLKHIWKGLVSDPPAYRTGGDFGGVLYPSNFGGMFVLEKIMEGFANRSVPARGNQAWEDWGLFLYGAIMTSQAFTDGNKRIARAAYGIMIASGGINLRVMNPEFGKKIGPMNLADQK